MRLYSKNAEYFTRSLESKSAGIADIELRQTISNTDFLGTAHNNKALNISYLQLFKKHRKLL